MSGPRKSRLAVQSGRTLGHQMSPDAAVKLAASSRPLRDAVTLAGSTVSGSEWSCIMDWCKCHDVQSPPALANSPW